MTEDAKIVVEEICKYLYNISYVSSTTGAVSLPFDNKDVMITNIKRMIKYE